MTTKQALAEARRRWGKNAIIKKHKEPTYHTKKDGTRVMLTDRFKVGRVVLGMFFEVLGDGPTWEAAFTKVDESKRRYDERYAKLRQ